MVGAGPPTGVLSVARLAAEQLGVELTGASLPPALTYLAVSDRERGDAEAAKLAEMIGVARVRSGGQVLDLGAGQGWHALRLASRFRVVAVEPSPTLARAARRRGAGNLSVLAARADELPLRERSLDAAVSFNTCLGYGNEDADRAALDELARVLRPGATAALELVTGAAAAAASARLEPLAGDALLAREPTFCSEAGVLAERETLVTAAGVWGAFSYRVRAYDPSELLAFAAEAGFPRAQVLPAPPERGSSASVALVLRAGQPRSSSFGAGPCR